MYADSGKPRPAPSWSILRMSAPASCGSSLAACSRLFFDRFLDDPFFLLSLGGAQLLAESGETEAGAVLRRASPSGLLGGVEGAWLWCGGCLTWRACRTTLRRTERLSWNMACVLIPAGEGEVVCHWLCVVTSVCL